MPYDKAGNVVGTKEEQQKFDALKKRRNGVKNAVKAKDVQEAAQRRTASLKKYKGKYAGPDKYKGVVPDKLKKKYKGKYFGKDKDKGGNQLRQIVSDKAKGKKKIDVPSKPGGGFGGQFDAIRKIKKPGVSITRPDIGAGFGTQPGRAIRLKKKRTPITTAPGKIGMM